MPVTPTAAMSAGAIPLARYKLAHDFTDVAPPLLRIFLSPTDVVRAQGDRPRRERKGLVGRPDKDADGRGRADVEAENAGHGWRLAWFVIPAQAGIQTRA